MHFLSEWSPKEYWLALNWIRPCEEFRNVISICSRCTSHVCCSASALIICFIHHSVSRPPRQTFISTGWKGWGLYFVDINFGSSPGLWAATAARYCPSRPGKLPKLMSTKYRPYPDGSPCTAHLGLLNTYILCSLYWWLWMWIDDTSEMSEEKIDTNASGSPLLAKSERDGNER